MISVTNGVVSFGLSGLTTDTVPDDFINRFFDDTFTSLELSYLAWPVLVFKGVGFASFGFTNFENTWRSPATGSSSEV